MPQYFELSLSVQAFVDHIPWDGQATQQITASAKRVTSAKNIQPIKLEASSNVTVQTPGLGTSVKEFFTHCQWHGRFLETALDLPSQPTQSPSATTPMVTPWTLNVGLFLQSIPWQGNPEIGSPPAPKPTANANSAEPAMALDDLAQLF